PHDRPTPRWHREFPLSARAVDHVRDWVLEEVQDAALTAPTLRRLADAVSETTREVRTSWSHAERLQVDIAIEYGAVEIRLTPLGESSLANHSEWLLFRPE